MSYEEVRLKALDGCQIAAWYIPSKEGSVSKKLAIVGHKSWAKANKSGCAFHYRHGMVPVEAIDYVKLHRVLYDAGYWSLSYHNKAILLFTIDPYYGNLSQVP